MRPMRFFPIFVVLAMAAVCCCCGKSDEERARETILSLDMRSDSLARYATCLDSQGVAIRLKTNPVGRYAEVFNDSNQRQWDAASKIGIKPITNLRTHWKLRRPLVKIVSNENFYIEPLTHSCPYLVPEAAALLNEIGHRFRDTLQARGGGDYRIRVTSVLRTPSNVRRLRRRNSNAVDSSVHQLGTTFDISYSAFAADSNETPRSAADLKGVLAEILYDLRQEGRCLVKYEKKQPCFHISAIK